MIVLSCQLEYVLAMVIKRTTPSMSPEEAYDLAEQCFKKPRSLRTGARSPFDAWHLEQAAEAEFHKLLDHTDYRARRRGEIAHDCWACGAAGERIGRIRFGRDRGVDALRSLAQKLAKAISELNKHNGATGDEFRRNPYVALATYLWSKVLIDTIHCLRISGAEKF